MKLEYIGLKTDGERFLQEQTGIEWMPGSVHEVTANHAQMFLAHPTIWKAIEQAQLSEAKTPAPKQVDSTIPEWAIKGIDAGLTDEQLESIAKVGGPDTESGSKLWLEITGKAYAYKVDEPKSIIRMPDGMTRILDGLDKEALHALAKELGVTVHFKAGAEKVTAALVAAFPIAK